MQTRTRGTRACLTGLLLTALAALAAAGASARPPAPISPLEEYVFTPDPAFDYTLAQTVPGPGFTAYILLMDSLRWRSAAEVDRTLWTHQLIVLVPDVVTTNTALMIINGGSDAFEPVDDALLTIAALLATQSGSVLAAVSQIPNQPLLFVDETSGIAEDELVAYSWDKAMDTGEAEWAAYLPMTKASVRAMDAVEEFVNDAVPDRQIDDFVVTGFSKRGATAYLVAAVDPRVRAVAPGVFDVLNIPLQIERHYRAYGFFAPAIEDYVAYDVVGRVRSPEGRFLTGVVDPLAYRATLTMPKFLLHATGDQFFLPDAANFYVDQLPGETLIRQVPNTDHGFSDALAQGLEALLAWYHTTLDGSQRPTITWQHDKAGALTVASDPPAQSAALWQVTNADARDFRLETLVDEWIETPLAPIADGSYQTTVQAPTVGYTGYLVVLTYTGLPPQTYSTPVFVTPDTLPFELDDPIVLPRTAPYWICQLPTAQSGCSGTPDYTSEQLQALLPFSVFGDYVRDLPGLSIALQGKGGGPDLAARQACTATRLNIAARQIGWYSKITRLRTDLPLWQLYADAESAHDNGNDALAERGCRTLNRTRPPVSPD